MKIKFEPHRNLAVFDLTSDPSRGGSACRVPTSDARTEVFSGNLHISVAFLDLGIEVVLDPTPGQWHDNQWARDTAWKAVCANIRPDDLGQIILCARQAGAKDGDERTKQHLREFLGLDWRAT